MSPRLRDFRLGRRPRDKLLEAIKKLEDLYVLIHQDGQEVVVGKGAA